MSELFEKSAKQDEGNEKLEVRGEVKRMTGLTIFIVVVSLLALLLVLRAVHAADPAHIADSADKYSLVSPGGIAFSDFRGYEDWATVSSARQDEILKVIVGNPAMIAAFKTGVPGNGQVFPDGSMIVKLQWTRKKDAEAQFAVDVPDVFKQAFVMEKDSKRFPKTGGWGYAVFNYDAASNTFTPDAQSPVDCGNTCHTAVKAKDYIFHPYEKR
jgi:Cytochrome P460